MSGGDILATASMAGLFPISMDPVYGLTKHGVVGFVRSLGNYFETAENAADAVSGVTSMAHTDADIDRTLETAEVVLKDMRQA